MVVNWAKPGHCLLMSDFVLTLDAVETYLARNVPEIGRLDALEKFDTGQSNPTYRLIGEAGTFVLRAKPPGQLLKGAHLVEREFRAMEALRPTSVPVPKVWHLASDELSPIGRAFFIMELVEGAIYWDPAVPELDNAARGRVYASMATVLAELHDVDLNKARLGDFGRPGNYFARQVDVWSRQYEASAPDPDPRMAALEAWLRAQMPEDDQQLSLVHGDYRLDNMVFDPVTHQVKALLDWELSTLGHPLADLAYQCMQWRLPHGGGMRGLGGVDRAALGLPDEAQYMQLYFDTRGLEPPENWDFYLAFSYFRLTGILQGVVRRAELGNASNPEQALKYKDAIATLVQQATDLIQSTGETK